MSEALIGNPEFSTTYGTYGAVVFDPSVNTLSTPHDYASAELFRRNAPFLYQGAKFTREYAEYIAGEFAKQNFDGVGDPASGVPVGGYLHTKVPTTTPVLYGDNDKTVYEKSVEMVGELPNVRFILHDMADVDNWLRIAESHFRGRRVGWLLAGSVYFLNDEKVQYLFRRLYEWSAPGSQAAVSSFINYMNDPAVRPMIEMMIRRGALPYGREPEHLLSLIEGWEVQTPPRNLEDILTEVSGFQDNYPEYQRLRGYAFTLSRP